MQLFYVSAPCFGIIEDGFKSRYSATRFAREWEQSGNWGKGVASVHLYREIKAEYQKKTIGNDYARLSMNDESCRNQTKKLTEKKLLDKRLLKKIFPLFF